MKTKKPEPKYKRGEEVKVGNTILKVGGCGWNKERQEFQYYIYPSVAPFLESELNRSNQK